MGEPTPRQRALGALVGEWEGPTQTWFAPGEAPHDARSRARFRRVLGGMCVLQEYESSLDGEPFEGMALFGWDTNEEKHFALWVDTFHMSAGPMVSKGIAEDGQLVNVLGTYKAGDEVWGWRTVIKVVDADHLDVVAFNITPAGEEAKAIETHYRRVKGGRRGRTPRANSKSKKPQPQLQRRRIPRGGADRRGPARRRPGARRKGGRR